MKKALFLFVLILCISTIAFGEGDFTIDAQTGTVTAYKGNGPDVVIPETIDGVKVKNIGEWLINANDNIKSVTIPEGVLRVERSAFYFCQNLESITLPTTLEAIDEYAFFNTGLTSVEFGDKLVFLGQNAFSGCFELENIVFKGELPLMNREAFINSDNEGRVYAVPENEVEKYNEALGVSCQIIENCKYYDYVAKETELLVNQDGILEKYLGKSSYIALPEEVNGIKINAIGDGAFQGDKVIRRIKLSNGITKVGKMAFLGSRLGGIELNDDLKTIEESAFSSTMITSLNLPSTLENIGESAFFGCKVNDLTIPEGIKVISKGAFASAEVKNLYLPSTLELIAEEAFARNGALGYVVFNGVKIPEIEANAFLECPIVDVDIPWDGTKEQAEEFALAFETLGFKRDNLTVWRANRAEEPPYPEAETMSFNDDTLFVENYTGKQERLTMYWNYWGRGGKELLPVKGISEGFFKGNNIKEFSVPHSNDFEIISKSAFEDSMLEKIYLFDSVTEIGENAFKNCINLKEIIIPSSVKHIGLNAFEGTSLTSLILPKGVQIDGSLGVNVDIIRFDVDSTDEELITYSKLLEYPWYKKALRQGEAETFKLMEEVPNENKDFEFDAENGMITKYLGTSKTCVVPKEINGIEVLGVGELAFSNFNIYDAVTDGEIEDMGIEKIILPETVTNIADSAFLNNKSLKYFECYGPVEYLGIRAFEECDNLEEVIFHNGLLNMGVYCFNLCDSLKNVELGEFINLIPEGAFIGCNFNEFVIDVGEVGNLAFQNCNNLEKVYITNKVKKIGDASFNGASALKEVYFEATDPSIIGSYVFDGTLEGLSVFIPESSSEEDIKAFVKMVDLNLLPGKDIVKIKEFPNVPQ